MKPENISDAMGYIEDELVVSAGESRNRKNNKKTRKIKDKSGVF